MNINSFLVNRQKLLSCEKKKIFSWWIFKIRNERVEICVKCSQDLLDIIMNYAIRELIKSSNYIRPFNDVLNENFMAFSTPKNGV